MEKQINSPRLRFPEFEGEWVEKKLEEVSEKIQDGTHFSPQVSDKGDFLYITSKNVKNGYMELSNAQYISKDAHLNIYKRCNIKKGDVLLTKDGTIGQTCVNELDEEFSLLSSVAFIRPNKDNSNYFIYQVLVSPIGQKEIESQIAGQALKRITLTKINNFVYYFPSLPEQTKIANFLTVVDEKLTQMKKKKSLLEQYKKGVMQKLFSQELRFKDENGEDFAELENTELGKLCKITTGKLDANAMVENGEYRFYTCAKDYYLIDKYAFDTEALLISGNGANVGYIHHYKGKFNAYQRTYVLDGFKENIVFIKYFLQQFLSTRINAEKKEGNTPYIVLSALSEMELHLPVIPEQTRIANFLLAIDDKISHCSMQIEKMEGWKKGLLQQMFV